MQQANATMHGDNDVGFKTQPVFFQWKNRNPAPEGLDGYCSNRSDFFSLGVIAYELITGKLPYGDNDKPVPAEKLKYISARTHNSAIQPWVDGALRKALHPNPQKRHDSMSEFLYDLSHANEKYEIRDFQPLLERNPIEFWRSTSIFFFLLSLHLIYLLVSQ